jgi:hypothetical protein
MRTYLTAWLAFGLMLGAFASLTVFIRTGDLLGALPVLAIPVGLSPLFGIIKYTIDKRRGRVDQIVQQQRDTGGMVARLTRDLMDSLNLGLYATIAGILVRAAGGPTVVAVALLVAGLVAVGFGFTHRENGKSDART